MKLKPAVKYQLYELKKSMFIYYLIIYLIYILMFVLSYSYKNSKSGGIESSSLIFIFICGIVSFKDDFKMFLQNSISRKTQFISFVYSIIPVSAIMALIDSINGTAASSMFRYESMYIQLYGKRYAVMGNGFLKFFEGFLWCIFAYAMMAMIGYFIGALYYRMNKGLRLLVSIGVPALLFVILPIIDNNFTGGTIYKSIGRFFSFAWGYNNGFNPYYSMVTCTIIFILFGTVSYQLMRNAQAKKV